MSHFHRSLFKPQQRNYLLESLVVFVFMGALLMALPGPARAQTTPSKPDQWVVTGTSSPNPVASNGRLTYQITAKNDGPMQSTDVTVTITLPDGAQFISCKTSLDKTNGLRCLGATGQEVRSTFPVIKAHKTVKVTVVVAPPDVDSDTEIILSAKAEGENAFKGDTTVKALVRPPGADVVLLPGGRTARVHCGSVLDNNFFKGSEDTVLLGGSLPCTKDDPFGLKIARNGATLKLQGYKILTDTEVKGQAGIIVGPNATNVTVDGGSSSKGSNGVENFDWCLKDEGGNDRLEITNLRCYKARSAALKLMSNTVHVGTIKIDSTQSTSKTTEGVDGIGDGIGIYAHGDDIRIKDTIVRRSENIGILADGTPKEADDYALTIEGNTKSSRIEGSFGIGVVFQNGPHLIKDTLVSGDGPEAGVSTDGIVLDTGIGHFLNGVSVKNFAKNGIVLLTANKARIGNSRVENVGQHGILISALSSEAAFETSSVKNASGSGFVVLGNKNSFDAVRVERSRGDGFQINGNGNKFQSIKSQKNAGAGYKIADILLLSDGNSFSSNKGEGNAGPEWIIGRNNVDDGSNKANKTKISFGAGGGTFE